MKQSGTKSHDANHGYVAVVPAGGSGQRVGGPVAKQYLSLNGEPMLAVTLSRLLAAPWIHEVHVIVARDDRTWERDPSLQALHHENAERLRWHPVGGDTRQETVANGLAALAHLDPATIVMVHDAARPGITVPLLEKLRDVIEAGARGAMLAVPVADTVKSADPGKPTLVAATVSRDHLWLAQTPQVYRLGELTAVLEQAVHAGVAFTDEAGAMKQAGIDTMLVTGHWRNLKVTTADDLEHMRLVIGEMKALDTPIDQSASTRRTSGE